MNKKIIMIIMSLVVVIGVLVGITLFLLNNRVDDDISSTETDSVSESIEEDYSEAEVENSVDENNDEVRQYIDILIRDQYNNCILLFAYHRTEAFPIDTWIRKAITEYFDDNFNCSEFGEYAGIAQQYLFYYERQENLKSARENAE